MDWRYLILLMVTLGSPLLAAPLPFSPAQGATTHERRPTITVDLPAGSSYRHDSARLWVNDREVSGTTLKTPLFVSYRPLGELDSGTVRVRFSIQDGDGVKEEWAWTFQCVPRERIESVTHNAVKDKELGEYDDLVVTMRAEPGGEAWFTLGRDPKKYAMTEGEESGLYQGTYTILPGDYKMGAEVTGHLKFGPSTYEKKADQKVVVFGHIFRVRVDSPKSGTKQPLNFKIVGRTRPRSKVALAANIGFDESVNPPNTATPLDGSIGGGDGASGIETRADEEGRFELEYGLPISLPNVRAVISVFAIDPDGNRSVPTILFIFF